MPIRLARSDLQSGRLIESNFTARITSLRSGWQIRDSEEKRNRKMRILTNNFLKTKFKVLRKNKNHLYTTGIVVAIITLFSSFLPIVIVVVLGIIIFFLFILIMIIELWDFKREKNN